MNKPVFVCPNLYDLRENIVDALEQDGPYSNVIIRLTLQQIDDKFGREAANETVRELGLEEHGFNQEPCNSPERNEEAKTDVSEKRGSLRTATASSGAKKPTASSCRRDTKR